MHIDTKAGIIIAVLMVLFMTNYARVQDAKFAKYELCNALNNTYEATQSCYSDQ